MVKCSFCGREEPSFRGIHLIRNIGVVSYFCSSKCRKNSDKLQRDKRKLKWTEAFHVTRQKGIDRAAAEKEKAELKAQEAKVESSKPAKKEKKK